MPSAQRMTHVDDLIERRKQQVFLAIIPRLAHRTPNVDNAVRNHESPQSKILKRKKARSNTPLSCKFNTTLSPISSGSTAESSSGSTSQPTRQRNGLRVRSPRPSLGM